MERPHNIDDLAPDIRNYILHLEQTIRDSEEDGVRGFLIVINRKMNQIKRSIDQYEFKIDSVEDKAFERFWTAATKFKDLAKDLRDMKTEYKISDEEIQDDTEKKKMTPQERLVFNRKKDDAKESN